MLFYPAVLYNNRLTTSTSSDSAFASLKNLQGKEDGTVGVYLKYDQKDEIYYPTFCPTSEGLRLFATKDIVPAKNKFENALNLLKLSLLTGELEDIRQKVEKVTKKGGQKSFKDAVKEMDAIADILKSSKVGECRTVRLVYS